MTAPGTFDVCGPLPTGTTVLEASAGTGKTFTIAALATRYVAEGHAELRELMLVTFGRAATQELRERVRERLTSVERGLRDAQQARAGPDDLLRLLADAPDDEVARRRARLSRALATFDAATIATTHGFALQMLAGLGVAGDLEPDATFLENIGDLVTEVVDDLYVRKYARDGAPADVLPYRTAMEVAGAAMGDQQARLEPSDAASGTPAGDRYGLAVAVRSEVAARKRTRAILDYDDLLIRLRDALASPVSGPYAAARIRARYRVVLVDEFQDTDPVQWDILRLAFHGSTTLVLIGDPKQAIYAFRGADVVAYLTAAELASTTQTLGRSWRSDEPLLRALDTFFGSAALGDPRIVVHPVTAAHAGRRLDDGGSPFRLRVLRRDQAPLTQRGTTQTAPSREKVVADLARDIVRVLESPATLTTSGRPRAVHPGDIAVLVRTNNQGTLVRDALEQTGVPAVMAGTSSVFASDAARQWLVLLQALEQPHRAGLVRAAALTCFLGWTAERLADEGEAAVNDLGARLRGWADVLGRRGVAALLETVTVSERLPARLLSVVGGERRLTDLRHVAQTLHAEAVRAQLGLTAVREWLQRRVLEAGEDTAEERSRRLESDARAVQVVTVHRSKGLEFPVVYVPFAWDRFNASAKKELLLSFHDDDGSRVLDVGGQGPAYKARLQKHLAEESGEDLRLLYVALTRAQSQVVAWWAPSFNTATSSMHRMLFGDRIAGEPVGTVKVPSDPDAARVLADLVDRSAGTIEVESVSDDPPSLWRPDCSGTGGLAAARFDRRLDTAWQRTSYSGLTAAVHEGPHPDADVGSEPEDPERADEAAVAVPGSPESLDDELLHTVVSPMGDLPGGAAFGTLVHSVLERVDTSAVDLPAELLGRCEEAVGARFGAHVDPAELAAGLGPVLETPLGPLAGGRRLADVAPADRLAELDFELPLAGGDDPAAATATLAAVGDVLGRHLPGGDPMRRYAAMLRNAPLGPQQLRGYLAGSIDAVLRLQLPGEAAARHVVVDYKTNWLAPRATGEQLTAWHYRPAALADAMLQAHYPLQALLYSVALHRFLRWRIADYDPERHLGGVLYLFVRGMSGPDTPLVAGSPCGVFSWAPPAALVLELSDLLHRGPA